MPDWKRKAVHASMGIFALALRPLDWRGAAVLAMSALLFNVFAMPHLGRGIYRDRGRRLDAGIVSYAAVVLFLVVVFRHRLEIAAAVWGMLAAGDPAAAITGKTLRGPVLPWNAAKTWSGVAANFVASSLAGLGLYRFVSARPIGPEAGAVLAAAAAFAFAESLSTGIEDNLVAPVAASLVLWGSLAAGTDAWTRLLEYPSFGNTLFIAVAVNAGVAAILARLRFVSRSGAAAGFWVGTVLLAVGSWGVYELLWAFFLLGTAATKLGYRVKESRGTSQTDQGRRGARHVLANCGVATVILLVAAGARRSLPDAGFAAIAGTFAAALADTLGTEIGSLAGRRPVSLLSLSPVPPGTPGAVSWPGSLAGAAGALAIGAAAFLAGLVPLRLAAAVGAGGLLGSLAESALTDAGRRRGWRVDHEFANLFNTFVGAGVAAEIALSVAKGAPYLPFES